MRYTENFSERFEKRRDRSHFLSIMKEEDIVLSTGFPGDIRFTRKVSRSCERLVLVDKDKNALKWAGGNKRIIPILGDIFDCISDRLPIMFDVFWFDLMRNITLYELDLLLDSKFLWREGLLTRSTEMRTARWQEYPLIAGPLPQGQLVNRYKRGSVLFETYHFKGTGR